MRKKYLALIAVIIALSMMLTGCEDMKQVVTGLEQTRDYLQEADEKLKAARGQAEAVSDEVVKEVVQAGETIADNSDDIMDAINAAKESSGITVTPAPVETEIPKETEKPKVSKEPETSATPKESIAPKTENDTEDAETQKTVDDTDSPMVFKDGMAQPMCAYSSGFAPDYTNDNSDILRFTVYVETDNDTDNDGMADLVKVFVQLPRAAAEGKYKAATIYDPTPYGVGTVEEAEENYAIYYREEEFEFDVLYKNCEKRTPEGKIDTLEHAKTVDPSEWIYRVPVSGAQGYIYGTVYDYYLTRGFAVVEASGIGTLGSDGFELCGFDLERDAHKCVVEWLTGDRVAYSDRYGNKTIEADWSNKNVAMTGCSYGGTLPFEVATTGVEGLKTIIPYAGIASWYDYTNSQGVTRYAYGDYADKLASFNGGGLFIDDDWTVMNDEYSSWLWTVSRLQDEANGDYTDIWKQMDYSGAYKDIRCSALIVHGLNDFNVTTKQADMMYKAFKKSGNTVKMLLHQDGHNFTYGRIVNGELWDETQNKWLSHYLYGIDNGIEDMAEVTVQSNIDGSFETYDSWDECTYKVMDVSPDKNKSRISAKGLAAFADQYQQNLIKEQDRDLFYLSLPKDKAAVYTIDIPEGTTIYGVPKISFQASTPNGGLEGLMATAVLVDTIDGETDFKAYMTKGRLSNTLPVKTVGKYDEDGVTPASIKEYVKSNTKAKIFSMGWMDLANPEGGPDGKDYTESINLQKNKKYDYTFYMLPTVYTVEKGHTLKLVLTTWDPHQDFLDVTYLNTDASREDIENSKYEYSVDNTTIKVEIPVK